MVDSSTGEEITPIRVPMEYRINREKTAIEVREYVETAKSLRTCVAHVVIWDAPSHGAVMITFGTNPHTGCPWSVVRFTDSVDMRP